MRISKALEGALGVLATAMSRIGVASPTGGTTGRAVRPPYRRQVLGSVVSGDFSLIRARVESGAPYASPVVHPELGNRLGRFPPSRKLMPIS